MVDLNSLVDVPQGLILSDASYINNNGQVFASAIPEPQTYALMLAGLGFGRFHCRAQAPGGIKIPGAIAYIGPPGSEPEVVIRATARLLEQRLTQS